MAELLTKGEIERMEKDEPVPAPNVAPNPNPNYPNPVQRPDSPNVVQPIEPKRFRKYRKV